MDDDSVPDSSDTSTDHVRLSLSVCLSVLLYVSLCFRMSQFVIKLALFCAEMHKN